MFVQNCYTETTSFIHECEIDPEIFKNAPVPYEGDSSEEFKTYLEETGLMSPGSNCEILEWLETVDEELYEFFDNVGSIYEGTTKTKCLNNSSELLVDGE